MNHTHNSIIYCKTSRVSSSNTFYSALISKRIIFEGCLNKMMVYLSALNWCKVFYFSYYCYYIIEVNLWPEVRQWSGLLRTRVGWLRNCSNFVQTLVSFTKLRSVLLGSSKGLATSCTVMLTLSNFFPAYSNFPLSRLSLYYVNECLL